MRARVVMVAVVLLVGCGNRQTEVLESAEFVPPCVEQPFRAAVHVDANDRRGVWATNFDTGEVVAVRPRPPGEFTFDRARPTLLFDGSGDLVTLRGWLGYSRPCR